MTPTPIWQKKSCTVYLLHFSEPVGGRFLHYVGQTVRADVMDRVAEHRAGRGSRLTKGAVAAGIEIVLVRVWEDVPRAREQQIKRRGGFRRLCPVCVELVGKESRVSQHPAVDRTDL